jgi:hypothetical protein
MNLIRKISRKLAYKLLDKLVIKKQDFSNLIDCSLIRDEYFFEPLYSNTNSNLLRYKDMDMPNSFHVSPHYLYKASNVSLIGPYGIPITSKGKIIGEVFGGTVIKCIRRTIAELGLLTFIIHYLKALIPFKSYPIHSGFYLVPRHGYGINKPNYCHWILENLPQLFSLEHIEERPKIIVNETLTKWQIESLQQINLNQDDIFSMPISGSIAIKNFYFSTIRSASSSDSDRDPKGRSWVKDAMKIKFKSSPIKKKRIFLSRQDMPRGFISNMNMLEPILRDCNIEIFQPGRISFQDDLDYLKDVELIIAPHGAGLANMIFSNNCHIIEIVTGIKSCSDFFYMTALEFNHTFETVFAKRDYNYESNNNVEEAWILDTLEVKKALNGFLEC